MLQVVAKGRTLIIRVLPPDHPTDTEIEMVISIALQTRALVAFSVETRRIELAIVRYHPPRNNGPTHRRRLYRNHLHNSNRKEMSDL